MARAKPRADLEIKSKRTWSGVVWHHSTTREGVAHDWEALRMFHTSYRVDGRIVDMVQYNKCFMQRKGGEFAEPMRSIGFHAGVEYAEGLDGVFLPAIMLGRSWELSGEHASYPGNPKFNNRYLGLVAIGDFGAKPPRPEMWDACLRLTRTLMDIFSISAADVIGHHEADLLAGIEKPRKCPGELWSLEKFRKDL